MNGSARVAVELPAKVVGADMLGQVKTIGEVHRRPPLTMAGRQINAGNRRVVATNPAAQSDLSDHQQQAERRQAAQSREDWAKRPPCQIVAASAETAG